MEIKKNPKSNLENYSKIFMQIGLVLALFVTYAAIEKKTYDRNIGDLGTVNMNAEMEEDIPITERVEPVKPKTPPPPTNVKSLAIRVNEDGTIVVNGRQVDIRRVEANIQSFLAENNQDSAAVQAHPKAKHGDVTEVINEVKRAGIINVSVLVSK